MKIFNLFDEDGSGFINFDNLNKVAADLGETMKMEELKCIKTYNKNCNF